MSLVLRHLLPHVPLFSDGLFLIFRCCWSILLLVDVPDVSSKIGEDAEVEEIVMHNLDGCARCRCCWSLSSLWCWCWSLLSLLCTGHVWWCSCCDRRCCSLRWSFRCSIRSCWCRLSSSPLSTLRWSSCDRCWGNTRNCAPKEQLLRCHSFGPTSALLMSNFFSSMSAAALGTMSP